MRCPGRTLVDPAQGQSRRGPGPETGHQGRLTTATAADVPARSMAEGGEIKDLYPLIDESSIECLNQDDAHRVEHAFKQVKPRRDVRARTPFHKHARRSIYRASMFFRLRQAAARGGLLTTKSALVIRQF